MPTSSVAVRSLVLVILGLGTASGAFGQGANVTAFNPYSGVGLPGGPVPEYGGAAAYPIIDTVGPASGGPAFNPWRPAFGGGSNPVAAGRVAAGAPMAIPSSSPGSYLPAPPPGPIESRIVAIPEIGGATASRRSYTPPPVAPAPRPAEAAPAVPPPPIVTTPPPANPTVSVKPDPVPVAAPKPTPQVATTPTPAPAPAPTATTPASPSPALATPPVSASPPPTRTATVTPPPPTPTPPPAATPPVTPPPPARTATVTPTTVVPPTPSAPPASTPPAAAPPTRTTSAVAPALPPEPAFVPPKGQVAASVTFAPQSAELTAGAKTDLDRLAKNLGDRSLRQIELRAYAGGGDPDSRKVSLARALVVRSYLIDRGVKARIEVGAYGGDGRGGPSDRVDVLVPNS